MITEIVKKVPSGYPMLGLILAAQLLFGYLFVNAMRSGAGGQGAIFFLASLLTFILWFGFFVVHPNEAKVLQLFGKYVGTIHAPGLRWANPFYMATAVSTRVRNFESSKLKVNDSRGSPIEIAAVVVWKVFDTAEAIFEVDDYKEFVDLHSVVWIFCGPPERSQGFAIIRQICRHHPRSRPALG